MEQNERKLVTFRTISNIEPIPGADAIEVVTVDGWKVVVKKGEHQIGETVVYFEIDSFLPEGDKDHPWQFLVDKSAREFEGVRGHRLRTVKLRGQVSQGLVLSVEDIPLLTYLYSDPDLDSFERNFIKVKFGEEVLNLLETYRAHAHVENVPFTDLDLTPLLGIKKWEQTLPAELAGVARGSFPSFIVKTDQERCQNLGDRIFGYVSELVPIPLLNPDFVEREALDSGRLKIIDGIVYSVREAKASVDDEYEVSLKADGSSITIFRYEGQVGVCSRNLELDIGEKNWDNSFVRMLFDSKLFEILSDPMAAILGNIAIQGELMGPGIQGNRESFTDTRLYVFNMQDINSREFLSPTQRKVWFETLVEAGMNIKKVYHVPVLHERVKLSDLDIYNVADLLKYAEGPSIVNKVREGLVFKRHPRFVGDPMFSFKAISDAYLLKEKD